MFIKTTTKFAKDIKTKDIIKCAYQSKIIKKDYKLILFWANSCNTISKKTLKVVYLVFAYRMHKGYFIIDQ